MALNNLCCIAMIQLYKYTDADEIRNIDDSLLFRYETFINFLTFSFSTRGERHTIFTMLTVPTSPTVNPPVGLARSRVGSQLTASSKSPNSQPIASGHDVIHTPVPFTQGFLLWHLWLSYPLRVSVNCTQCVCAPALRAE